MQKQQGGGTNEPSHNSTKTIAKYQALISNNMYGKKPAGKELSVTQPGVVNQEVQGVYL